MREVPPYAPLRMHAKPIAILTIYNEFVQQFNYLLALLIQTDRPRAV